MAESLLLWHELLPGLLCWLVLHQVIQWWQTRAWRSPHVCHRRGGKANRPPSLPGLIKKPHCEACAQEAERCPPPPPSPPPMMGSNRGCPRRIDTRAHYCPHASCRYYGWLARGNIRANGHPTGRGWRQLYCAACGRYFLETHGTLFYGKSRAAEDILRAIAALAEGLGIRAVGRVFDVDANPGLAWLIEAAEHAETVSRFLLHDLKVKQVQLDELFALVGELRAGQIDEQGVIERLARRPRWVWTAIDPVSKLLIAVAVGERSLAMAQGFVHQVVRRLAPGGWPLFLSDGYQDYGTALLTHFGQWLQPPRRQPKGPAPKPRWCAHPRLLYAQVIKQCRRRRLVRLIQRVIFGAKTEINQLLAKHGWHINTAFVERLNLTLRQHVAAIGRRVITLAKTESGLRQQLYLFQAYYNLCLPHASLRQVLLPGAPASRPRSAKRWQGATPAMAAGLTDHAWSVRELLLFRVPPWSQPALE